MKVTVEEIRKIKPGGLKSFALDDGAACNAARALVGYVKQMGLPDGISDYTTKTDWENHIITISAIAK